MKALIVENEPVARLLLEKQICSFGFDVTTCTNGEYALVAYKHTFYPLIVLDLGLPDMYGLDLCRQIRGMSGGDRSVILVITERHDPEYLQAILQAGADDYLTKPVSTELLKMRLTVIERQLQNLVEYRQIEEHLCQLEKAVETLRLGVTITDPEGKIVYTNPAEAEMHGHQVEDLIGSDLGILAPPELRDPLSPEQIKTMKHRVRESVNVRKDGSVFPVRLISDVLTNEKETPVAIFTLSEDITEYKQAMEQLRFQAQLLDNVRESVIATDLEGRVIYWSKGAEALYGYLADEVIGEVVSTSIGPFEEVEGQERIRQVFETGTWNGQYVQQRKNGTLFLSDTVISLMTNQKGQPWGLISIDRDITERRQMEETLRYSEERYRILVESASDPIFMLNANGDFLSVNQETAKNFGKLPESIIGKNLKDLLPKEIATSQLNMLQEVFRTGKTCCLPDSFMKTSSGEKWFSTVFTPITDRHAHVVYVIGMARDITDRKRAEEQLRFQAQLLNSVREAIVATDLGGHIIYWGSGAEELYGYSAEEMIGKSIALIVASQNEEAEQARMRLVHKTGKWSGQYMKRRKDGSSFWADTVISLVTDQHGQPCGFIGIDRDIADRYSRAKHLDSSNIHDAASYEDGDISSVEHEPENVELHEILEDFEKTIITETLEQNHWYRGKTAEKLGLTLKTLHRKMKKYQLI
jgi:PAS domain S-box-containing protein